MDTMQADNPAMSQVAGDSVFFEESLDATRESGDDLVFAAQHRPQIKVCSFGDDSV